MGKVAKKNLKNNQPAAISKTKTIDKSAVKRKKSLKEKIQKRIGIDIAKSEGFSKSLKQPKYKHLEQKYLLTSKNIEDAYESVTKLINLQLSKSKQLLDEEVPILLQFCAVNTPVSPRRILRIPLKHKVLTESSEICLIVADPPGIPKKETERVNNYYEELLKSKGVSNIKTVIPFYQLKTEYENFELKRRLVELYDAFLVDGRVSGYVVRYLGKIFYKKRKTPTSIKMDSKDLPHAIENALNKAYLMLHSSGDSYSVQVGHNKMGKEDIIDNVFAVIQELDNQFPGGWNNIRNVHLKGPKTLSVPVYLNLKSKSSVPVPIVESKRPKAYKEVTGELSTKLDSEVTVTPSGDVIVNKIKNNSSEKNDAEVQDDSEEEDLDDESEELDNTDFEYDKNTDNIVRKKKVKAEVNNESEESEESGDEKYTNEELAYLNDYQHESQKPKTKHTTKENKKILTKRKKQEKDEQTKSPNKKTANAKKRKLDSKIGEKKPKAPMRATNKKNKKVK